MAVEAGRRQAHGGEKEEKEAGSLPTTSGGPGSSIGAGEKESGAEEELKRAGIGG